MVISQLIKTVVDVIGDASDTALIDARAFLKAVLNKDDVYLTIYKNSEVDREAEKKILEMADLRKKHMPVAYIIGYREFMSLTFRVSPGVLIPRPDTECIVEEAINCVKSGNILDIGTGSGAIAVSLAKYISDSKVSSMDISAEALDIASENAESNGVNVNFIHADILQYESTEKYDCIISNPPYIEKSELPGLMADVLDYEPAVALDGGEDGLIFYRAISEFAFKNLNSGGKLIYEFGWKQHDDVKKIIELSGLVFLKTIYDLSGIKRGLVAVKGDNSNDEVFK